ncbi:hypothetical protein CLI64_14375 [Nostoc sp. CENA543]|uniref:gamma-glutamylcyclotransferase family protein n=1 Tax=Nostoc sp. CENA543 TaxID=1869241 RepID=UPI000CA19294|nr:gamma-glutamylcyclotransferase [Nostoc sp. CENA543]AUT01481.1 hypothetical protein CLI64_14375 [Nostoc sp. CENA543]
MAELHTKNSGGVRIFVYGTLKPGEINYQRYCTNCVVDAQKAMTRGELFALPMGYPAMTMGKELVHGYLLTFAEPEILDVLDYLEDYEPTREMSANLYNRYEIEVYSINYVSLGWAWVYVMNPEKVKQLGGRHLVDGCWSGN